jgi:hypothetical protein
MRLFQRRRRAGAARPLPPDPSVADGPLFEAISGGAMGCLFCAALREMFTFDWATDRARFDRLWRDGFCAATIPGGPKHARLETDGDFSSFRLVNPVNGPDPVPALWFRDSDMVMIGSNSGAANVPGGAPT